MSSLRVRGVSNLMRKLRELPEAVAQEVRPEIARGGLVLQNDMRRSIQKGPKTGRTYKRTKDGKFHRASAPGQAPATDSGRLVAHIQAVISSNGLLARVGIHDVSSIVYAARMEFGGRDSRGIYIAPRPYVRPALKRNGQAISKNIRQAYKVAIRKASNER